ncbi:hypothetical protein MVEN_02223500 [Mycena venus]|uniref:Uncharacterized protein n=1 Tax=Mycena venus TaxID=2733690 RepID=A0A8H7CH17_9AGAR|nr:hypothetical protein MVEN_02223500 [Mycena venus]
MQFKFLVAFVVSCLSLSVAAAPIAGEGLHVLDRSSEPAEIARAPEPEPGCKMYNCIWCKKKNQHHTQRLATTLFLSSGYNI